MMGPRPVLVLSESPLSPPLAAILCPLRTRRPPCGPRRGAEAPQLPAVPGVSRGPVALGSLPVLSVLLLGFSPFL